MVKTQTLEQFEANGFAVDLPLGRIKKPKRRAFPNGCIYQITNTQTNETYIGATICNARRRFKQHCSDSYKGTSPLHRAIRQYGFDSFTIEVIATCLDLVQLAHLEMEVIAQRQPSYNRAGFNDSWRVLPDRRRPRT